MFNEGENNFLVQNEQFCNSIYYADRLCGRVVRVPGYRPRGPSSIPGATKFSK
jgi:hypothetical protein